MAESAKKPKEQLARELTEAKRQIAEMEGLLSGYRRMEEEKKDLEKRLGEIQRMDFLGRLSGEIAHDINNMLYPIIIDAEFLLEDLPQESTAHQILKQMLSAARRQKDLVNQIFTFSRRGERERNPLEIKPLIRQILDSLQATLPEAIELKQNLNVPRDIVKGDPQQLRQIIMNLVHNAAESIGNESGTIEVSLSRVQPGPGPDLPRKMEGPYLELSVSDTGKGMTREAMEHIFDPSYASGATGRSTMLGLAITKGMVEDHGGEITIESEPERGSRFTVRFPAHEGPERVVRPKAVKASRPRGKKRILLVDDEDIILSSIQRVLMRLGYEVAAVNDSVEALEMFTRSPQAFDLVITDLTMPRMTGAEFTSRLLAVRPDTPVILSTGFSDVMNERKAKEMGIREFLVKPAGIDELKSAISRSLEEGNRP
ncbi:MAG: response regulator [Desulfomonilia bacterium]|jgi:signal transduction histidine kinase/CheY-like chemotaxis protein|nr:response regulator [Deltaproteobacteria bacterium]MDX9760777.1 response regulator [Desulfomonilia bacterium]